MLAYFYHSSSTIQKGKSLQLDADNSKHIVQVLRKKEGEQIKITNGKGILALAEISVAHKKHCQVQILDLEEIPKKASENWLAISFTKNRNRTEWLIEKATELGVDGIIPLHCKRSERTHWNVERIEKIAISALLQSQQVWLPKIVELCPVEEVYNLKKIQDLSPINIGIAHCMDENKSTILDFYKKDHAHLIFIGPEGDFTIEEVNSILQNGGKALDLGKSRLRTETAGLHAISLLNALRDAHN